MNILELSSGLESTKIIADNLAECLRVKGHCVDVIAPVRGILDPRVMIKIIFSPKKYHIIHAHLGKASRLASIVGKILNIPVLTTLHGFQKAKDCKNVKFFTAVSHEVKQHYIENGVDEKNITVILNGFNPNINNNKEKLEHVDTYNKYVLGNMGGLCAVKRQGLLIEALKYVAEKYKDILLILAGTGAMEEALKEQVKELNLQDKIVFTGHINSVSKFYNSLDLYVHTAIVEGFGMPILDAMACGVPVVVTDNRGSRSYIENNISGIILKNENPKHIAEQILKLIKDKDKAKQLAAAAKKDVQNLKWEYLADQYENLMINIVKSQGKNKIMRFFNQT